MIKTYTYTIAQALKRSKNFINRDLVKAKNQNNFYIMDFIGSCIDDDVNNYKLKDYTAKNLLHNEKVYKFLNTILFDGIDYTFNNDLILSIAKNLKFKIIQ